MTFRIISYKVDAYNFNILSFAKEPKLKIEWVYKYSNYGHILKKVYS